MKNKISTFMLKLAACVLFLNCCRKADKPEIPLSDVEGNTYQTIKIGSQVWMAENLKTTRFNDETEIPLIADDSGWASLTTPGCCWYTNDAASFKDIYGALYNGYSLSAGKLCPVGWHVPAKEDWQILRDFIGDSVTAGGKLKEAGTAHWLSPNFGADNSSGFTAVGAGIRYFEGTFASVLSYTGFWSATGADNDDDWYTGLYFNNVSFVIDHANKKNGFSVRCIKD